MINLVIGDVHFGIKSNSVQWLNSQIEFFKSQVYNIIENNAIDRVIFLGDLFDVRTGINTFIAINVKNLFKEMLVKFSNIKFIIIAGNHDIYSPLIKHESFTSLSVIFGDEFQYIYNNLKIVDNNYYIDDNKNAFLPWFWTEDIDRWNEFVKENNSINCIFCHSDLSQWDYDKILSKGKSVVFSGHLHSRWFNEYNKLYCLGSCCSFTFNDVNTHKYIYIINGDGEIIKEIQNTTTPEFKRFFNEEIFTLTEDDFKNRIVQLWISSSNINKAKYIERIKEIKISYINYDITINVIDDSIIQNITLKEDFNPNISLFIANNMPKYLINKYKSIKKIIESR